MSDRLRPTKADKIYFRNLEMREFADSAKWFISGSKLSDYVAMRLSYYINKGFSLVEWAKELEYNRNLDEWNDCRIEHTQWQDNSGGFKDIVPFSELVLYLAVKYLYCTDKEFTIKPPHPISDEYMDKIINRVSELVSGKGYMQTKDNPDSFRVKGLNAQYAEALKPREDLHNNLEPTEQEYVTRGIRGYLGKFADSFPFGTEYEIIRYKDAKKIYAIIIDWRLFLKANNLNRETITRASTNITRGYKALTLTQLKKHIKADIAIKFMQNNNSKRKSRIISRATELILK